MGESDLTKCVKCGRICIKKYAQKQNGLCLDCHDEELKKTLGLERYKKIIREEILEQTVLVRIEEEFYETCPWNHLFTFLCQFLLPEKEVIETLMTSDSKSNITIVLIKING